MTSTLTLKLSQWPPMPHWKSHMSQLSKTMVQLTQNNQAMAASQQQNQLALVDHSANSKLMHSMHWPPQQNKGSMTPCSQLSPKFDGTNKEDCAVWLSRITSLVATTGWDLCMELLNWADGNVMTMLAGINEEVDDEALKEEIMRCFFECTHYFFRQFKSWGEMQQRQGEQARLYITWYEVYPLQS